MKLNNITYSAISLALIFVFFMTFRGALNIFNSILVPLVLYITMRKYSPKEMIATFLAMIFLSGLFFLQQLFFAVLYGILAVLLMKVIQNTMSNFIRILILSLGAFVGFIVVISLTDFVIGTQIMTALLSIAGGWYIGLFLIILLEAIFVGAVLTLLIPIIEERIRS